MKSIRFCLNLLAYFVLATCVAQAQASRTWVSGVGDDANPCSRTAPCNTFAGAISKTAAGGEIDALDPAGFGAVTITKSMTLDGGGGQVASVLVSGTNGIVVSAGANDTVTLRNLSINGLASGINGVKFVSGSALHVEHCTIFNFANHGIDLEPSAGGQVFVVGTVSRGNAESGLSAVATVPNVNVTISDSQFERNRFGIFAGDFSRITVRNSEASGNQVGFVSQANAGQSVMNLVNSTATNNTTAGVQVGGGSAPSAARVAGLSVLSNGAGFLVGTNGTVASFGNNYNTGNGTPNASVAPQ